MPDVSHLPKNHKVKSLNIQASQTGGFKGGKGQNNSSFMFLFILIFIPIIFFFISRYNLLFVINYLLSIDIFWFNLIPTMVGCVLILFHLLSVIILLKFSFVPGG